MAFSAWTSLAFDNLVEAVAAGLATLRSSTSVLSAVGRELLLPDALMALRSPLREASAIF